MEDGAPAESDPETLRLIYQEIKDRLAAQFDQVNAIDTKAGTLIGLAGVLATVGGFLGSCWCIPVVLLVPLACALFVIRIKGYRRDPEPRPLWEGYKGRDHDTLMDQLIANWLQCYEENRSKIKDKLGWLRAAYYSFGVGVILIVAWLILVGR